MKEFDMEKQAFNLSCNIFTSFLFENQDKTVDITDCICYLDPEIEFELALNMASSLALMTADFQASGVPLLVGMIENQEKKMERIYSWDEQAKVCIEFVNELEMEEFSVDNTIIHALENYTNKKEKAIQLVFFTALFNYRDEAEKEPLWNMHAKKAANTINHIMFMEGKNG